MQDARCKMQDAKSIAPVVEVTTKFQYEESYDIVFLKLCKNFFKFKFKQSIPIKIKLCTKII